MHPSLEKLLALQERDQRLGSLRQELAHVPTEKEKYQKQLAAVEARLEAARSRSLAIEVERKSLEVEVSTKESQIARYRTQQMQTRKNEEYSALAHEIEGAENIIHDLEDKELVLMEEAEALIPVLASADEEARQGRAQVAERLAALEEKAKNLQTRIQELDASRPDLLADIDPTTVDLYERLFRSKSGQAIVALAEGICQGCHMKVPAQTAVEVRQGQNLVHCPLCGRLLFDAAA
jgi:predicted  nucleic acid-binding Zn-ribbon protein